MTGGAHDTAEAVARRSYGKLVALLAARTRDIAAAEDALADAFAAALADWPAHGTPSNPEAWLFAVARRKTIDSARRQSTSERLATELQILTASPEEPAEIPDHRLALLFVCAHPALDASVRAPLMLQVVLGLNANAIASAFLTSPSAMSKRLVRAKEKIRATHIPFRVPERGDLPSRVNHVLDAIYAAFAEGWSDPVASDPVRRDLSDEALFLGRLVVELLPDEPEAAGLLSLMLHGEARRQARRSDSSEFVPLAEQDHTRWDWDRIREAESLLTRASAFHRVGRYQLEAALQSAHVHRHRTGERNWGEVVRLYDALLDVTGSPVVALNRALAIGHERGFAAALTILNELGSDERLTRYQPYWAARADVLAQTGAVSEARLAYDTAIGLERDDAVRRFLARRRSELGALES